MTVETRALARAIHALGNAAAPALSLAAIVHAFDASIAWRVAAVACVVACLACGMSDANRGRATIELGPDGLVVGGTRAHLRSAWLGPGWLVVRGLRDGARFRASLFAFETTKAEFARLRAFCVAELPRVNPPRVGARRACR